MFSVLKKKINKFVKSVSEKENKAVKVSRKTKIKKILGFSVKESDLEGPLWEFQLSLLEADVSLEVAEAICEEIRKRIVGRKIKGEIEKELTKGIREILEEILEFEKIDLLKKAKEKKPLKVIFVGPNGSGKTTTIAKVANMFKKNGMDCVLAAADTFRAASIEQLQVHADRLGVKLIKHDYGADPAAVIFDAVKYAESRDTDAVLADTAGRQETNVNLVEQMKKISRVNNPDLKIFVGESVAGNAIVEQISKFNEAIGLDGVILTKLDVDEKGGTALSVSKACGVPIIYVGMGQDYDSLLAFDKETIIKNLLS